jgi:hypothetical protein
MRRAERVEQALEPMNRYGQQGSESDQQSAEQEATQHRGRPQLDWTGRSQEID